MWRRLPQRRGYVAASAAAVVGGAALLYAQSKARLSNSKFRSEVNHHMNERLPPRQYHTDAAKSKELDVLVIGGGATGAGCALDAVSRGLSVAMVEKFDFASGTSSRSTKLIHGGVRYLQKAVFNLDYVQYKMVKEALSERGNLLEIAPHLAYKCPIMLPLYKYWQIPYFWAGLKTYDMVAGSKKLEWSYFISKKRALELFPMLKPESLVGALVYYDGQHEDARMCLSLTMTAVRLGAHALNYTEVISLLHKDDGDKRVVCGARVRDKVSGEEYDIKARCVVNATGPYTDQIRTMENDDVKKICQPSAGTHIILPNYYSPQRMGLLDPATSDGRIIFFLPWQGMTIAGTTDNKCELTDNPSPTEEEVQFILQEIKDYLNPDINVRRGDVLSCWTGLRPLVMDPNKKDTQSLARNHIIEVGANKLLTIAGGKWTTYREMAEETIDKAVDTCDLKPKRSCQTLGLTLDGGHEWSPTMHIRLVQDFGLDVKVAEHLSRTYGDRAPKVCKLAQMTGRAWPVVGRRLHPEYPYIEAEVLWAVRVEYARRALDVVARRTRLAFLNVAAAEQALPRIVEIMGKELGWDAQKCKNELDYCIGFLEKEMGLHLKPKMTETSLALSKDEVNLCVEKFQKIDKEHKGFVTLNDLRSFLKAKGESISEASLREMLNEVDLNKNGEIDLSEYLQLMSAMKGGNVSHSRLASATQIDRTPIPTDRSGGGL
ncbi:glycerol-3-phosphate dehydrogenase, mitochondrial-like isoform X2 [Watersipora subatra]